MRPRAALVEEDIAVGLRSGDLVRLRRGAYVSGADLSGDSHRRATELALAHVRAVVTQSTSAVVVSHLSAALLFGLPLVRLPDRVHVTQQVRPRSQRGSDVFRHTSHLTESEVCTLAGMRVTSLARTTIDCLRVLRGPAALVLADAALRAGLTADAAADALGRATGGRGVRNARGILSFADDGAESAGESYARAVLLGLGLPVPETQVRVDTVDGSFWADLGWREWRLLAEYDGRSKYGETAGARDALLKEKRREDVVRDEGWRMLRMTSDDTAGPGSLLARLSRVAPRGTLEALTPRPLFLDSRRGLGGSARTRGL